MNALDIILVLSVVIYALAGYQQGFLVGSTSTFGLLIGGFAGVRVAPMLLDGFAPGLSISIAALLVVLACAFLGQAAGSFLGSQLRARVTWQPARVIDALSGAALSVVAMLLIAWVLGVAASGAQLRTLNQEVRSSVILGAVDEALPGGSDRVLSAFNALVDSSRFPRYLEPFAPERIKKVPPPTSGVTSRPAIVDDQASVVKVLGSAASCSRTLEGSGFVYSDGRVMTNAHVVAGVTDPVVRIDDTDYPANVVFYDPDIDIAVLSVPDLDAPTLAFDQDAASGDQAAALGYPENGPYLASPVRVREQRTLRSPNIYGDETVYRDTYSLYAQVRPGNSGGPLVSLHGDVIGVIFAASVTDSNTGYALTASQVSEAAQSGVKAKASVGTGGCAL
jgi:S1-C subfamily serine protease